MCKFAEKDVLGGGFLNFDILSRFDFKQKNPVSLHLHQEIFPF
jgi:hypothetical protein